MGKWALVLALLAIGLAAIALLVDVHGDDAWLDYESGGKTIGQWLGEIVTKAEADRTATPAKITPAQYNDVINAVIACSIGMPPPTLPFPDHAAHVVSAHGNAMASSWQPCIDDLLTGH